MSGSKVIGGFGLARGLDSRQASLDAYRASLNTCFACGRPYDEPEIKQGAFNGGPGEYVWKIIERFAVDPVAHMLLFLLHSDPSKTDRELAAACGMNRDAVSRAMRRLKQMYPRLLAELTGNNLHSSGQIRRRIHEGTHSAPLPPLGTSKLPWQCRSARRSGSSPTPTILNLVKQQQDGKADNAG